MTLHDVIINFIVVMTSFLGKKLKVYNFKKMLFDVVVILPKMFSVNMTEDTFVIFITSKSINQCHSFKLHIFITILVMRVCYHYYLIINEHACGFSSHSSDNTHFSDAAYLNTMLTLLTPSDTIDCHGLSHD